MRCKRAGIAEETPAAPVDAQPADGQAGIEAQAQSEPEPAPKLPLKDPTLKEEARAFAQSLRDDVTRVKTMGNRRVAGGRTMRRAMGNTGPVGKELREIFPCIFVDRNGARRAAAIESSYTITITGNEARPGEPAATRVCYNGRYQKTASARAPFFGLSEQAGNFNIRNKQYIEKV